jgi:hypothetical protein
MIGAKGMGAAELDRDRVVALDFEEDRELDPSLPPPMLLLLEEVRVRLRVGKEKTLVVALRMVAP